MAIRIKDIVLGWSLFIIALITWQILSATQIVPPWLLSPPEETFSVFLELISNGTLIKLLFNSFLNVFPAFIISLIFALVLGTLVGANPTFSKMFSPFLAAIHLVPSLAWLPLIILFFGFTRETIWIIIFISSFIRMIYSIIGGVQGVNQNWLLVAQNLELNRFQIIIRVVLPGALPQILSGIRVGFGSAWRSLVGAEMLVVTAGGLGKYIWMSQWAFKFDQVISGIIVIALVGVIVEQLVFKKIERITLVRWGLVQI
ncbi:MAG: ABC transporter permease subunit [Patescibacteria group bacterium]|jgi:ABC-type nitrate/sulfonate/bicarbonate transport system permease component